MIIKTVRSVQYKQLFTLGKIKIPPLDVPTRWNSTFLMFKAVHDNKLFYKSLEEGNLVSENLWHFLEEFVIAFEPVYSCTKKLQKEQFTIGDSLRCWIDLKMQLTNVNNEMSKEMLSCMLNRQTLLVDNDLVKAALYLD